MSTVFITLYTIGFVRPHSLSKFRLEIGERFLGLKALKLMNELTLKDKLLKIILNQHILHN